MLIGVYFGVVAACACAIVRWHTKHKAAALGDGSEGAAGGGGGRRGYAQLEKASTFEMDDSPLGCSPAGQKKRLIGGFGDDDDAGMESISAPQGIERPGGMYSPGRFEDGDSDDDRGEDRW